MIIIRVRVNIPVMIIGIFKNRIMISASVRVTFRVRFMVGVVSNPNMSNEKCYWLDV